MALYVALIPLSAQSPTFDVVSIKPSPSGTPPFLRRQWIRGRFTGRGLPLGNLIRQAFGATVRLDGGPGWVWSTETLWDIDATFEADHVATAEEARAMLQALLAEYFQFRLRKEIRQTDVYVLTLVRSDGSPGPSLLKSELPCTSSQRTGVIDSPPAAGTRPLCLFTYDPPRKMLLAGNVSLATFLGMMEEELGRPVVDHTGLSGTFDIVLYYEQMSSSPAASGDTTPAAPALIPAFREQLGLTLDGARAPLEYSVIDHVEKPAPN
jgi:uncharacterized protein (TIGR03435 family)